MDKPKNQKKKIIEIPQYNDPMNKEGVIPTDVLGSYSGAPAARRLAARAGCRRPVKIKKFPEKKLKPNVCSIRL